ncbi:hypothetical protein MNBD_GAMMA22-888 [hydrothermal vent metagenome]|uniref:Lipoprotein n=1 Tax=hydrothermal vent metagenome TaxID=652676 RepID=A0A3B1A9S0_9ZZZZ
MVFTKKFNLVYLLKITGLITVLGLLSACHSLPIHHGYGHSSSYSTTVYQSYDAHPVKRIRSVSRSH